MSHKISNIVQAVLSEPWLILDSKLEEICAFLELRADGFSLSEEEIRERFGRERSEEDGPIILDGGIQVINVHGTLAPRMNLMARMSGGTSTMQLAKDLHEAGNNSKVSSIVLNIDSPGGAASYTPEAAAAVRAVSQSKRIVTSATNMMASGAYWLGVASDYVYASQSTQVGSIGVYSIMPNYKEAYEKSGVKFAVLRAGSLKAAGNPYEELTSERLAALQKRVDDIYVSFISSVAEFRKTSTTAVEKQFGQGNVFLADEAKSRGMIDEIATFEEVLARERDRTRVASRVSVVVQEGTMNPKVKAALFARGLIEAIDADDATCNVALRSFRVAVGNIDQQLSEDELVKCLFGSAAKVDASEQAPASPDLVQTGERSRVIELKTRGKLLSVEESDIDTAIAEGVSVEDALVEWTGKMAKSHKPVTIRPGDAEADKIAVGAGAVLCKRYANTVGIDEKIERDYASYGASLRNLTPIELARTELRSRGLQSTGDKHEDAKTYLENTSISVSEESVNRRGDHPSMLSALVRKSLTRGAMVAPVQYTQWCERIEDLTDFKPRSFIDAGIFRRLDAITEDDKFNQLKFESDLQNWISVDRFGNSVGLTVEMLADDDLGGFARQLRSLGLASRLTVQEAVLSLLNANPTMPDGNAFFSSAHSNLVSAGNGAPSATQLVTHRRMHRLAASFGTGGIPMGASLSAVLVPATLEEVTLQTVAPVGSVIMEQAAKATDATLNTFRGKVNPIIDAHLDSFSTAIWYSMIPVEQASPIVYAFQSGFGEEGRREEWYDASRKTRYVSLETRFGVAMANWRAMIRNNG